MGVTVRQKVKGKGNPWWIFISHQGKRTSRRIGDKKAAEKVGSVIRAKLKLGEFSFKEGKPPPTFEWYADNWIKITVPATCKNSTLANYKEILENHVLPVFKDMVVTDIKRKGIQDFLVTKINKGYSVSSVGRMKNVLSGVMMGAVDDEVLLANPVYRIKFASNKQDRTKNINPYSAEELNNFLNVTKVHFAEHYTLCLLMARTGLREGEALALEWGDINFSERYINVQRGIYRGEVSTPKNGKTRRVDISPQLTEALLKMGKLRVVEGKPDLVFTSSHGGYICVDGWRRRVFNKILKKAETKRIRIHDLRHTYATLRIAKGDNIADVSNQLGHHSVKFTMDAYYHWIPGDKKSEVDALDSLHSDAPQMHPDKKESLTVCG